VGKDKVERGPADGKSETPLLPQKKLFLKKLAYG
jgi:hypothetical protein